MSQYPEKLAELAADFALISDRNERIEYLIEIADRFDDVRVTPGIAVQPYDEAHRAPACESEAFVWAIDQPKGGAALRLRRAEPAGFVGAGVCGRAGRDAGGRAGRGDRRLK